LKVLAGYVRRKLNGIMKHAIHKVDQSPSYTLNRILSARLHSSAEG
jgi:hypothetical protein